jgi:hypothetical protein
MTIDDVKRAMMSNSNLAAHLPDCDINDRNPDGIRKPCNCGIGFNPYGPSAEHHEKPTLCPECQAKQEVIDKLRMALADIRDWKEGDDPSDVVAAKALRETKP